jgi:hypothetical protein
MNIRFKTPLKAKLQGTIGKYEMQVGILEDKPYKEPKKGKRGKHGQDVLSSYAGGPIRQTSGKDSGMMISDVSKENRERLGVNYLRAPFKDKTSDIARLLKEFFLLSFGRSEPRRLENLLQAIVRNPILRGDYGHNSKLTQAIKGFDRSMIDTAQLFKAIKAKVVRKRV